MKQAFHILKKDIRHLWIEICISLAAMTLVTYFEWQQSLANHGSDFFDDVLPPLLLVLCWWLMTARLVQDEALVGDRQFWITRPYVWYKLVAAKAMFVLLFVGLPLVISQVFLLVFDGWPIGGHISLICGTVVGTFVIVVLPCAAAATLTKTIPQWLMAMVAIVFCLLGIVALDGYIPNSRVQTGSETADVLQSILFTLFLVFGVAVLYYRRKRLLAAISFALAVLSIPGVMIATPYKSLINKAFPSSGENVIQLNLQASQPMEETPRTLNEKKRMLVLPLDVSGIAEDAEVQLAGTRLFIDSPDGRHWESNWETNWMTLNNESKETKTSFRITKEDYEKLKSQPVLAHLELAVKESHEINPERVILQKAFDNHRLGRCRLSEDGHEIHCRSASKENNQETTLSVQYADSTCSKTGEDRTEQGVMRRKALTMRSGPFNMLSNTTFSSYDFSKKTNAALLCAGTPVTFSIPELRRRYRIEVELGKIDLTKYVRDSGGFLF